MAEISKNGPNRIPRVCGGEPYVEETTDAGNEYSPRMRG